MSIPRNRIRIPYAITLLWPPRFKHVETAAGVEIVNFLIVMAFVMVAVTVVCTRAVTVWVGAGAVTVVLTVPESTVDVLVADTVEVTNAVKELVIVLVGAVIYT